jgi:hypothetical protein
LQQVKHLVSIFGHQPDFLAKDIRRALGQKPGVRNDDFLWRVANHVRHKFTGYLGLLHEFHTLPRGVTANHH